MRLRRPSRPLPPPPPPPPGKAVGEPPTRAEKLHAHVVAGRWREALRLAVKLSLGDDKVTVERAWEAMSRPDFTRQLGRDPEALIEAGKAVLLRRFSTPPKAGWRG